MKRYKFSLITEFANGGITGPMSPVLFAREVAKIYELPLIAVYYIDFTEHQERMYQRKEADGWTGCGQLLICFPCAAVFFVDEGVSGLPIASIIGDNEPLISNGNNTQFMYRLRDEELIDLMKEGYKLAMDYKEVLREQMRQYKELLKAKEIQNIKAN
jgi:hypothetical protein